MRTIGSSMSTSTIQSRLSMNTTPSSWAIILSSCTARRNARSRQYCQRITPCSSTCCTTSCGIIWDGHCSTSSNETACPDGYLLVEQTGNTPQFYHVAALKDLWLVAQSGRANTFHFNILRTILEKTALFHGHSHFSKCIKTNDDADGLLHQRFVDLLSHGKYSMYEPTEMGDETKEYFFTILKGFVDQHPFNRELLPEPPADTEAS